VAQTTRIDFGIDSDLSSALDLVTVVSPIDISDQLDLASGTGAGQADMQWSDRRTLAASATEDLDLAGSLTGPFGTTLTFARIKAVYVKASTGNTNAVQVTRPASNGAVLFMAAGDGISLAAGERFAWWSPTAAGKAVTAATGDLLTFTNSSSGTGVTYDIVVIGASA
jgi:hypothetical protein